MPRKKTKDIRIYLSHMGVLDPQVAPTDGDWIVIDVGCKRKNNVVVIIDELFRCSENSFKIGDRVVWGGKDKRNFMIVQMSTQPFIGILRLVTDHEIPNRPSDAVHLPPGAYIVNSFDID